MIHANYTEMMQTDSKAVIQTLANDPAFVRELVQQALNTALEAAMTELLGAGEVGAHGRPSRVPFGVLHAVAVDEGGHREVEGAPGSCGSVQHRGLRAVSALGEGVGGDARGDVREGGLDAQGGRDGGTAVWSRVFGSDDLEHGGRLGSVIAGVGGPTAAGGDGPSDSGRALREGSRGGHGECAGGADRGGHRRRRPATRAGGGTGDQGKRVVVDRVSARFEGAWTARRGVCGVGQSRRFEAGDRQGVDPGTLATLRCAFSAQRERQAVRRQKI